MKDVSGVLAVACKRLVRSDIFQPKTIPQNFWRNWLSCFGRVREQINQSVYKQTVNHLISDQNIEIFAYARPKTFPSLSTDSQPIRPNLRPNCITMANLISHCEAACFFRSAQSLRYKFPSACLCHYCQPNIRVAKCHLFTRSKTLERNLTQEKRTNCDNFSP